MNSSKNKKFSDKQFKQLASNIKYILEQNNGLVGNQKEQVELVFSLERKFQYFLIKESKTKTTEIYAKFCHIILDINCNILTAKPYFRERGTLFKGKIFKDIKNRDFDALMKYNISYTFIQFIVDSWEGKMPKKARDYYEQYVEARRILIENNLPLAINRAKLFYRKTQRSSLTLLDFIDICTYGLIVGVDKYIGKYTPVWAGTCIGRMTSSMIEEYSRTFIRLTPSDKKILYRAISIRSRQDIHDMDLLTRAVNESFMKDKENGSPIPSLPIKVDHLRELLNSCSYASTDNTEFHSNGEAVSSYYDTAPSEENIEEKIINSDLMCKLSESIKSLSIMERKVLRLKGVTI